MESKNADIIQNVKQALELEGKALLDINRKVSSVSFYGDGAISNISFTYI